MLITFSSVERVSEKPEINSGFFVVLKVAGGFVASDEKGNEP